MEVEGNVLKVGVLKSGTSQSGNDWQRQDVVIEYFEHHTDMWSQKIVVSLMGDKINQYNLHEGDKVKVRFGLNYREYQGNFYQEVRLAQDGIVKLDSLSGGANDRPKQENAPQGTAEHPVVTTQQPNPVTMEGKSDDLPF